MRTWVFSDFSVPTEDQIRQYAEECGFSDVVLGVSNSTKRFHLNYTPDQWLKACDLIFKHGMQPHFMVWAIRTKSFIDEAFSTLAPLVERGEVDSILLNAEGTWHAGKVGGSAALSPVKAATAVNNWRRDINIFVGVVGFDQLHKTVRPLVTACDYVIPEAYSFWKPGSAKHWSHSWRTFPGPQQRRAAESWDLLGTHLSTPFAMGMACYYCARPQRGVAPALGDVQSMWMAASEVVSLWSEMHTLENFWGLAYWSGKHLRGTSQVRQARRRFIRQLADVELTRSRTISF